jgi:Fe-S cluster assembly protein SufD
MTPADLNARFDEHVSRLPGSTTVRAARESALAQFAEHGFPSRKTETWRYTNVAPIVDGNFEFFPPNRPVDAAARQRWLSEAGVGDKDFAVLIVDGAVTDRTNDEPGFEVLELPDSINRYGIQTSAAEFPSHPFAALNVAFARDGAHIRVGDGAAPTVPLHVVLANSAAVRCAVQPQLIVDVAPGASAKIVVHLLSDATNASWVNLLTRVTLARDSSLELCRLQRYGNATLHTELLSAVIGNDAKLTSTSLDIGGQLVRSDLQITMQEPDSRCDLAGLVTPALDQLIDNHVTIDHCASHSTSAQRYRAIVGDRGRAVFNGKVVVHRNTVGIEAVQSSDNLLLAASGEIDTKPELEIYADDVKCSHGATIGEIDEAELFYLRARGIDEPTARGLLTLGFAETTLARLPDVGARSAIAAKFGLALPSDQAWRAT